MNKTQKLLIGLGIAVVGVIALVGWVLPVVKQVVIQQGVAGPTPTRTQASPNHVSADRDTATGTFVSFENTSGVDRILMGINIHSDPDDATYEEIFETHIIGCATSTLSNATSTDTMPLVYESQATSTVPSHIASSTFSNPWQRVWASGEFLNCSFQKGSGQASPGSATPSSTGAVDVEFFIK